MDMYQNNPYMGLSGISAEELGFLQQATADLNETQLKYFYMIYSGKRKSPQDLLIFCAVGFCIPGLQRFVLGQIGMGILYVFTANLCFIGWLVDIINYKSMAMEHNKKVAYESFQIAKMSI